MLNLILYFLFGNSSYYNFFNSFNHLKSLCLYNAEPIMIHLTPFKTALCFLDAVWVHIFFRAVYKCE